MKRDWNLIRDMAFAMEQNELPAFIAKQPNELDTKLALHLSLMEEGGYREGYQLTAKGREFIELARSDSAWNEVLAKIEEWGGLASYHVKELLERHYKEPVSILIVQ